MTTRRKRTPTDSYAKRNPWVVHLYCARQRCGNKRLPAYPNYGGRGIKCFLSREQIKALWDRDGASALTMPSIDRIDVNGHYEVSNCRFIEMSENAKRRRNVRTGCVVCGPEARHRSAGFCAPHFNHFMKKKYPENAEQKALRRDRERVAIAALTPEEYEIRTRRRNECQNRRRAERRAKEGGR